MGFKTFLEKYLDTKMMWSKTVEFFVDPTSSEAREMLKNDFYKTSKLLYSPDDKKLYLFSDTSVEHNEAAKELKLPKGYINIMIQGKKKTIEFYRILQGKGLFPLSNDDAEDFEKNVFPKLKKIYGSEYKLDEMFAKRRDS